MDTLAVTLLAGRDGISNTLEVITYVLACYPEEQQKLLDEINSQIFSENGKAKLLKKLIILKCVKIQ
jgi:cytochrome P450